MSDREELDRIKKLKALAKSASAHSEKTTEGAKRVGELVAHKDSLPKEEFAVQLAAQSLSFSIANSELLTAIVRYLTGLDTNSPVPDKFWEIVNQLGPDFPDGDDQ